MKKLTMHINGNELSISFEKEMDSYHKSSLDISKKQLDNLKDQAKDMLRQVKGVKGFKKFSMGYGTIDWYESCRQYEVPYIYNEEGRIKVGYQEHYDIPKDWTFGYSVRMDLPDTVRGINKVIEAFGYSLSNVEMGKVREIMKAGKGYLEFER